MCVAEVCELYSSSFLLTQEVILVWVEVGRCGGGERGRLSCSPVKIWFEPKVIATESFSAAIDSEYRSY